MLQTTVAEIVTVKEHQRMSEPMHQCIFKLTSTSTSIRNHAFRMVPWVCTSLSSLEPVLIFLQLHPRTSTWWCTRTALQELSNRLSPKYDIRQISLFITEPCVRGGSGHWGTSWHTFSRRDA